MFSFPPFSLLCSQASFDGNAEELLNSSGEVTAAGLGVSSLTLHTCNGMPWG